MKHTSTKPIINKNIVQITAKSFAQLTIFFVQFVKLKYMMKQQITNGQAGVASTVQRKVKGVDELLEGCPSGIELNQDQEYFGGSCIEGSKNELEPYEDVCPECRCVLFNKKVKFSRKKRIRKRRTDILKLKLKGDTEIKVQSKFSGNKAACLKVVCKQYNKPNFIEWDVALIIEEKEHICNKNSIEIEGIGTIHCPSKDIECVKNDCKFGCTMSSNSHEKTKSFLEETSNHVVCQLKKLL